MSLITAIDLALSAVQLVILLAMAAVVWRGYNLVKSRTLRSLAVGFAMIGAGVFLLGASALFSSYAQEAVALAGTVLQAGGYWSLALSHFYTVRRSMVLAALPFPVFQLAFSPYLTLAAAVANSVVFFLLLYILSETMISFYHDRLPSQLPPLLGFFLLTISVYSRLFLSGFASGQLLVEVTSLAGFAVLSGPVLMLMGVRHRG
ncbi:MAG: hypothetical protein JRN39_04895 [Nitrososphaerota archaeon]|nr:hypothetical protein [Nitrososphaerota archaeon]MDG6939721.1 hypothetical protein [Nitrososphaerota archaeon]